MAIFGKLVIASAVAASLGGGAQIFSSSTLTPTSARGAPSEMQQSEAALRAQLAHMPGCAPACDMRQAFFQSGR